jgi:hypothetical protein
MQTKLVGAYQGKEWAVTHDSCQPYVVGVRVVSQSLLFFFTLRVSCIFSYSLRQVAMLWDSF